MPKTTLQTTDKEHDPCQPDARGVRQQMLLALALFPASTFVLAWGLPQGNHLPWMAYLGLLLLLSIIGVMGRRQVGDVSDAPESHES